MADIQKHESRTAPELQSADQRQTERFVQPRASVWESTDSVVLELEMPGVTRDQVEVTVHRDELTVTGWRTPEDYEKAEVLHCERILLNYRRSFVMSDKIDSGRINAAQINGVLTLTLPKSEGAKPRRISID